MLNRTDLRGQVPTAAELRAALPRAEYDVDAALHHVRPVVEAVRDRGVEAVLEYTEQFDKVRPARTCGSSAGCRWSASGCTRRAGWPCTRPPWS
jgi:histidinol dehydrogenase